MQDAKSLLDQFFGSAPKAKANRRDVNLNTSSLLNGKGGLATGALAGGIAGLLLSGKKSRKLAKNALKVGGVALVGGIAYKAWRDWQSGAELQSQPASAIELPPQGSPFDPSDINERSELDRTIIRSMIAAAKADGRISSKEQETISRHLHTMGLGSRHRKIIEEEMARPLDIDALVERANCAEQAAEIYAAAVLVVDQDDAAGRGYLAMLAARLDLDPLLVEYLHAGSESLMEKQAA